MLPRIPVIGWRAGAPREARAVQAISKLASCDRIRGTTRTSSAQELSNEIRHVVKQNTEELENTSA